ncbi:MAG: GNAT family N-acetyltransferase [Chloroflexi bacterium]|nr:GNAT family N-acetyltransferase [Chloroflexota bacterium]
MPVYQLTRYPKEVVLRDGARVVARPMVREDMQRLLAFFIRVDEADRHYLKEDVTSPKVAQQWSEGLDYDRSLPLLALADGRVVADATLHRRRAGARCHVGEVRVVVDPEYRNRGLGTALISELAAIAYEAGLERLTYEVAARAQTTALQTAERLGFVRLATLPGYIKDVKGSPDDLVIMDLPLGRWYEWWQF